MSEINITLTDSKSHFNELRKREEIGLKRHCGMCKKEFSYDEIIKKYPKLIQDSMTSLWKNSEIKFYCFYCHLLKLVRLIKKSKKKL